MTLHYLQGRSHLEVAHTLNISKAVLYRRAELALTQLAALLAGEERLALSPEPVPVLARPIESQRSFPPPRNTNACLLGREDVLAQTFDWLENGRGKILSLHGPSGIGKSALAIEIASSAQAERLFPDGIALFEVGPNGDNLGTFLEACAQNAGMDKDSISQTGGRLANLTALTREALKTARVLFILDDVCALEHFAALDVAGPYSACIVTTRMPGLAQQISGKNVIKVEALSAQASMDVLGFYAPDAVKASPDRAVKIAELLGGLPVALVLAGHHLLQASERLNQRILDKAFAQLISSNPAEGDNIDDQARARQNPLAQVFEACVSRLSLPSQKLLTALGVFAQKPASIGEATLISVTGASTDEIDELVEASFLEPAPDSRYTIHQSFYEFACDRLKNERAQNELYDKFVKWAAAYTEENRLDYIALEKEFPLIQRAINIARSQGWREEFGDITLNCSPYLRSRGRGSMAFELLEEAYEASSHVGDECAHARIANELCQIAFRQGDDRAAWRWATVVEASGEEACAGAYLPSALETLCVLAQRKGEIDQAVQYAKRSVALSKHARHGGIFDRQLAFDSLTPAQVAEIAGLNPARGKIIAYWQKTLIAFMRDGDMPAALGAVEQALELAHQTDDPLYIVHTLGYKALGTYTIGKYTQSAACANAVENLFSLGYQITMLPTRGYALAATYGGISQTLMGDYKGALETLEKSLEFGYRTQSDEHLAWIYFGLACSHHFRGESEKAYVAAQHALAFAQKADSRDTVVSLLRACGSTAISLNRIDEGMAYLRDARRLAIEVWTPLYTDIELALGHARLGNLHESEKLLRNASAILRKRGAKQFQIKADFELSKLLYGSGRRDESRVFASDALSVSREIGDMRGDEVAGWLAAL